MHPHDSQRIFDLRRLLRKMPDVEYLLNLAAYHAAPTLQGIKPATLICPDAKGRDLEQALGECGKQLREMFGCEVADFRNRVGALLLLVYHPGRLRSTLAAGTAATLLQETGYGAPTRNLETVFARLRERCSGLRFPHEIGVFLGYPPEDVRRFMREGNGAGCRRAGCWKAYADEDGACRCAARFRNAKCRAADLIVCGADLREMRDSAALAG